ncbi:hypothetical protein Taro_040914 [Colocasia esculenta]|uniref:Hydroxyproline-rich glycoprotein family protein n=1 Tax=Colocasia esculenta TaxID=4460 RepID=A0A843WEE6_COLES|nr:hypothetical protein [Colocasia esculenta]
MQPCGVSHIFCREVYEYMLATQNERGRSKSSRESISPQKLQTAQEDYDEEATLFVFRLKSLKQGQSRSLLTQAARHHSAQLSFFRKGTKSLEAVEPHVKLIAEKQHIDYQFSGLEDYDTDGDENEDGVNDSYGTNDDGELSFDYGQNEQGHDVVSTSRNSMEIVMELDTICQAVCMCLLLHYALVLVKANAPILLVLQELDQADHTSTTISTMETTPENLDKSQPDLLSFRRPRPGSQSAPIFPEKKFDPAERIKDMRPSSTKKFHTYVLPTPVDCKSSPILSPGNPVSTSQMDGMGGWPTQLWHSSPLEPNKHARNPRVELPSNAAHSQSILKESNIDSGHVRAPPPLAEGLLTPLKERLDHSSPLYTPSNSDPKKIKRQAYSGPLPSKGWSSKPLSSIPSVQHQVVSPMPSHVSTTPPSTSPKVSPNTSPRLMPSPKINELHELPRPPPANLSRPYSLVGHSGPLVSRGQELSTAGRIPSATSQMASPLPTPPVAMARSFSIPSSSQRMSLNAVKLMETSHNEGEAGEISSPLQIPIYSTNSQPESTASESVLQPAKAKVARMGITIAKLCKRKDVTRVGEGLQISAPQKWRGL